MAQLFEEHSAEEQALILSLLLPQGETWRAKNIESSVLYKLLIGYTIILGGVGIPRGVVFPWTFPIIFPEEYSANGTEWYLNYSHDNLFIPTTTDMISDWEITYGMYNNVFADWISTATLEERRSYIITLIQASGTSTAQQFIDLAAVLGYTVTITPGPIDGYTIYIYVDGWSPPFDQAIFNMSFDFMFGTNYGPAVMGPFFEQLKPANCRIVWWPGAI